MIGNMTTEKELEITKRHLFEMCRKRREFAARLAQVAGLSEPEDPMHCSIDYFIDLIEFQLNELRENQI